MIEIVDQFLSEDEYYRVESIKYSPNFRYGEYDVHLTTKFMKNGMTLDLTPDYEVYQIFSNKINNNFEIIKNLKIYRMYVNCFAPSEWSYYHTDSDDYGITFLYYINDFWEINDGGETHFLINDEIKGILPIPNRLIMFDSRLLHRATPFKSNHRFSLAVKYC